MEAVPHVRKLVLAGAIATVAALGASAPAFGKGCLKDPPSSVAQYTEQIPQACGSSTANSGSTKRPIPKSLEKKIDTQGGQDADQLKEIVSSGAAGAPTETKIKVVHKVTVKPKTKAAKAKARARAHRAKIVSDSAKRQSNPLAASVGVITDGSDGRLIALIALMIGVAALVVVSALRRRRVTR
jgi:hypothetical protein